MNTRRTVNFESMHLQVGTRLQLQVIRDVKPIQYFSSLIGYIANEYMILRAPMGDKGWASLREGEKANVRVFSGTSVCTFDVTVLRIFGNPLSYIHVSFPDRIFASQLRGAMRIKVDIPARISRPDESSKPDIPVTLHNLSTTGALIETGEEIGKAGDCMQLAFSVPVFSETDEEQISIPVAIRNATARPGGSPEAPPVYQLGVEFQEVDPRHQVILQNMTYQTILRDRQRIV